MPNDDEHDSWHSPKSRPGRGFVGFWRRIYHPLGFKKGYNFPLFVILVGALMGFVLARFSFLDYNYFLNSTIPGEPYWYASKDYRRIGIQLHLSTILPAGFLACFQFVPVIRHKVLIFHRINGYVILTLYLIGLAGILMIGRHAAGGGIETQTVVGLCAIMVTTSLGLAYYNIKRLQIDQHRAWMIRAWMYAGSIISLRLILLAANKVVLRQKDYYGVLSCDELFHEYSFLGIPDASNPAFKIYPQCVTNTTSNPWVAIPANATGPEGPSVLNHLSFGMAFWIALFVHAFGTEIYLNLTPAEGERLRAVSYERQLEAGFENPGSAGLTVDNFGDAPKWGPKHSEMGRELLAPDNAADH